MHKTFLIWASLLGALSVALSAFGAHMLKDKVSEQVLGIFETAVRYQFYHVFALLIVGILFQWCSSAWLLWSGRLFISGIILFSGSLYALTYFLSAHNETMKWIGAVTPFGGLCLITGWLCMGMAAWKR